MSYTKTIAIFISLLLMSLASEVQAEPLDASAPYLHAGFCDDITSTADALPCLTEHKNAAEKRLKEFSETFVKNLSPKQAEAFRDAQDAWLSYRDKVCALEKDRAEGVILQQLALTSCLAIETDHRAARLANLAESDGAKRITFGEYGLLPRWLNGVLKQDKDVFWTSRRALEVDLNCDGRKEQFVTGLAVSDAPKPTPLDKNEVTPLTYDAQVALALAADPVVGRPDVLVLRVPVQSDADANELAFCSDKISVSLIPQSGAEKQAGSDCTPQDILVSTPGRPDCDAIRLGLNAEGKPIRLENQQATN